MAKEKKKGFVLRALDTVEHVGNALPNPATIFLILTGVVIVLSAICAACGVSVTYDFLDNSKGEITQKTVAAVSLLAPDSIRHMVAVFMAFPTAVALTAGAPLVQAILDVLPSWVTGGLSVAGKLLPGLGIAMLLHYMPAKKYFNYILIGFVLSAYMGVPILGIAFLGVALAYKFYMDEEAKENVGFAGGLEDE